MFRIRWTPIVLLLVAVIPIRCVTQQIAPTPSMSPGQAVCIHDGTRQDLVRAQFKEAEAELRHVLATDPSCAEAHFLLAYTLLRQNLPKASLAEYTAGARIRTPTAEDLRDVALDYVLLDDYIDAANWAGRAIQANSRDAESWYVLGRIRYSSGKFQDAADAFTHSLSLEPENVKAEDNLGLAYQSLNQIDKAIDAYRTAIAFGEKSGQPSAQPMIDLAIVLDDRSDLDGALTQLSRAVALAPEDSRAREHLGHVYLELNQLPKAQTQLEKAVLLSPRDARLHFLLGQVYRREGIKEKADAEFARFASLNGTQSTPDYVK